MRALLLSRIEDDGHATFGILTDEENKQIAVTLERPWLGNAHDVSCIPTGVYVAERRWSEKHKANVFGLLDVPHRDDIEIHTGNLAFRDSLGCILVGNRFGPVDGGYGVQESRAAYQRFLDAMRGVDRFTLTIVDAPAGAPLSAFPATKPDA